MFNNSFKPDEAWVEGTVTQVDVINKICKVVTSRRQSLDSVKWGSTSGNNGRGGDRSYPMIGDRVCVTFVLGYPLIAFYIDRMETGLSSTFLSIADGPALDTGTYASTPAGTQADTNQPPDTLSGDRILSSVGGGLLGLLRTGSILIRSGRLAEIFMSKLLDLVRIVSRNFEHFHSVGIDVIKNYKGQVYRYQAYSDTYSQSVEGAYKLRYYYGNTAAAEIIKDDYLTAQNVPAPDGVIFKQVVDGVYARTLNLQGTEIVTITGSGAYTKKTSSSSNLVLTFKDKNTITINEQTIYLNFSNKCSAKFETGAATVTFGGSTVIMDDGGVNVQAAGNLSGSASGGVSVTSGSGGSMSMNESIVQMQQGGHGIKLQNSSAEISSGQGGILEMKPASTELKQNGHGIAITDSGMEMSAGGGGGITMSNGTMQVQQGTHGMRVTATGIELF